MVERLLFDGIDLQGRGRAVAEAIELAALINANKTETALPLADVTMPWTSEPRVDPFLSVKSSSLALAIRGCPLLFLLRISKQATYLRDFAKNINRRDLKLTFSSDGSSPTLTLSFERCSPAFPFLFAGEATAAPYISILPVASTVCTRRCNRRYKGHATQTQPGQETKSKVAGSIIKDTVFRVTPCCGNGSSGSCIGAMGGFGI
jgi:hypothetical protein